MRTNSTPSPRAQRAPRSARGAQGAPGAPGANTVQPREIPVSVRVAAPRPAARPSGRATPAAAQALGLHAQVDMPLTTTPEERMDQMRVYRDAAAAMPGFDKFARGIIHDRCVAKMVCPTTPRGVLQAFLSALPDLVEYTPDPPGKEIIQSVPATLNPSKGTELSPLTGKNKGRGDCKDLSILYSALAKSAGFDSVFLWFDQPSAPINHVAVYADLPGEGWQIVETTVPGARVGQDPYSAIQEFGFGNRVGRTTAHDLCEKCVAPPNAQPNAPSGAPWGVTMDATSDAMVDADGGLGESVHADVPGENHSTSTAGAGCPGGYGVDGTRPSGLAIAGLFSGGAADATRSSFQGDAAAAASVPQPAWPGFPAGTRLFVVQATEQSDLARYYPPANLIDQMMAVAGGWRNGAVDHWVGAPRITRTGGPVFNITTTVAALWAMGPRDDATLRRDLATLAQRVQGNLARIDRSDWGTVTVSAYNPTVNGPLEFWSSGAAARTTTRDDPPGVTTSPPDNPRGETTPDTHPGSPLPDPGAPLNFLKELQWVVIPVAAVGGLLAARPYFDALFGGGRASGRSTESRPRQNPRQNHHRRRR